MAHLSGMSSSEVFTIPGMHRCFLVGSIFESAMIPTLKRFAQKISAQTTVRYGPPDGPLYLDVLTRLGESLQLCRSGVDGRGDTLIQNRHKTNTVQAAAAKLVPEPSAR